MRLANSDLRSLSVFRAIVENGGFLAAQIALGLSQSSVSFHVNALEQRLGFQLCTRGRAGFQLTEKGLAVYERSREVFLALNAFETDVGTLRNEITGKLRLGIVDNTITDGNVGISETIAFVKTVAPKAEIEIHVGSPDELLADVARGTLEIAIVPDAAQRAGTTNQPLHIEIHCLYCGTGHPLFHTREDQLTPEVVGNYEFVVRPYAKMQELRFFPSAKAGASASNMEAQAMFVKSGCYIGYLPQHYAEPWVDKGIFRAICPDKFGIVSQFVIASRAGAAFSPVARIFAAHSSRFSPKPEKKGKGEVRLGRKPPLN